MLAKEQKKSRHNISKYLLSLYEDDPEEFMHHFVTKMRLRSITLILRPKAEYAMEGPWLTTPKKFKSFFSWEDDDLYLLGLPGCYYGGLP